MAAKKKKQDQLQEVKNFFLMVVFAVGVLILAVSLINVSKQNIVGKVSYQQIRVYGEVSPKLSDGAKISFKIKDTEIASAFIKDNKYGYEEDVFLLTDDPSTPDILEGYAKGHTVIVYIEDIEVAQFSYFDEWENEKNIQIPVSKMIDVANKAAYAVMDRNCVSVWQCDEWSECKDGKQTRSCKDTMNCRQALNKPLEERNCEKPFFADVTKTLPFILFFALVIIGFFVMMILKFKPQTKKR